MIYVCMYKHISTPTAEALSNAHHPHRNGQSRQSHKVRRTLQLHLIVKGFVAILTLFCHRMLHGASSMRFNLSIQTSGMLD